MAKENNYEVHKVSYRKSDGTSSERAIIKIGDVRDTILAVQVDHLSPEDQAKLQGFLKLQKADLNAKLSMFGVEFKSFKPGNLTYLDGPQ